MEDRLKNAEAELIAHTLAGDADAFAALVRRHQAMVLRAAQRIVGEPEEAKDVAQETSAQGDCSYYFGPSRVRQ
jgi:DNA-directed RNA polymerase specialized sigma24 family protein